MLDAKADLIGLIRCQKLFTEMFSLDVLAREPASLFKRDVNPYNPPT
jgi:hypothetical protein